MTCPISSETHQKTIWPLAVAGVSSFRCKKSLPGEGRSGAWPGGPGQTSQSIVGFLEAVKAGQKDVAVMNISEPQTGDDWGKAKHCLLLIICTFV